MHNFHLKTKLIFLTLTAAILPVLVVGVWSISVATDSMLESTYARLEAMRDNRKAGIELMFKGIAEDTGFIASLSSVSIYFEEFASLALEYEAGYNSEEYQAALKDYDPVLKNYAAEFADMYLLSEDGDIIYSAMRNADYAKNITDDETLANSGLARVFQKVQEAGTLVFEDFSLYKPLDGEPSAFVATPLTSAQTADGGILVLRISTANIDRIMRGTGAIGKSGETYLVAPDKRMRSDAIKNKNRTVKASLAGTVKENGSDNEAVQKALSGQTGRGLIQDTWEGEEMSATAYAPVQVFDRQWALVTEIAEWEMREPVNNFITQVSLVGVIMFAIALLLGSVVIYSILRQLGGDPTLILQIARDIAKGDLHIIKEGRYKSSVHSAMCEMVQRLRKIILESGQTLGELSQGNFAARIRADQEFVGDFTEIRRTTNEMADKLQVVIDETGNTLGRLSKGELQARIQSNLTGDFSLIKDATNDMADKLQTIIGESRVVLGQLAEGDLKVRIEREFVGDFSEIKSAANDMAEKLQLVISESTGVLGQLSAGNLKTRIRSNFVGDFSEIKSATNEMVENLQSIIIETDKVLKQLSQGDMEVEVLGNFPGDFVEIKKALENSVQKLAETTGENNRQNWLKSGQAQLGEKLRGEQDVTVLAKSSIDFIATYLDVQLGLLYVAQADEDGIYLQAAADYGYVRDKQRLQHKFRVGEALVGQAMLERKAISRSHAGDECEHIIQSGLAQAVPKEVLLIPFMYEDEVKGVVELGSYKPLNEMQREFLEQAMPSLGIAVNGAESRNKTEELLKQSQAQSEELKKQQAAMAETNEKLKQQQAAMAETNEKLQNQAEELQSQTEEMQAQQEELRQTNEALEERGKLMEEQRREVEKKNTELEKTKAAIQAKAEELELASKYKSEFLANMSHELRTPLNSLLILSQLLSTNKDGNLTEKQVECATTIYSAGSDLLTLINEILDLSKVEAGKIEINPDTVVLRETVTSLERKFRHVADERALSFAINFDDSLPESITTDAQRLQQVLNNMLSNAFKFTEKGGVTVDIRRPTEEEAKHAGLPAEESITFSVTDTGIGIPKDKQQAVFEAFQQADGTTSRRFGGTGLGLSISRQLAQLMGGEIQLYSEEGQGSRFLICLPHTAPVQSGAVQQTPVLKRQKPAPKERAETAETTETAVKPPMKDDRGILNSGDKSLLIIEDDRAFSKILMELSREKGFKCLLAEDGRSGLQLAEEYTPGAIILDVGLPQVDGWTVMEKLKDNPDTRHIPVHFVSGNDDHEEAQKMGAVGYAVKPVSMSDLGLAFQKLERFIGEGARNLLLVSDNENNAKTVRELVDNAQVNFVSAGSLDEALPHLRDGAFDCVIVDNGVDNDKGLGLLERLCEEDQAVNVPFILYTDRDLNNDEEILVQKCARRTTIKVVRSPERLLDETSLFLHEINAKLPEEQQRILRMVHDKEAILANKKVLVVDDDTRNIFAITVALESKGMEVVMSDNAKEGLALLREHKDIAIVLMDIMMPEMDGYTAMQKIRKDYKLNKLPIIALTAKAMRGDRAKCIEAGANDYLSKPVDTEKLLSLMRVWLYQ